VRGLVLAHHWTLSEIAALTVEQLRWCQQWQSPATPARVGREEARAIVAAKRDTRAAWVATVLNNKASAGGGSYPRGTQFTALAKTPQRRGEQVNIVRDRVHSTVAPYLLTHASGTVLEEQESFCPRDPSRIAEAPSIAPIPLADVRDAGALSDLIVQLAGQLDRLERRIQRGAPLGP